MFFASVGKLFAGAPSEEGDDDGVGVFGKVPSVEKDAFQVLKRMRACSAWS